MDSSIEAFYSIINEVVEENNNILCDNTGINFIKYREFSCIEAFHVDKIPFILLKDYTSRLILFYYMETNTIIFALCLIDKLLNINRFYLNRNTVHR